MVEKMFAKLREQRKMSRNAELRLDLKDTQWDYEYTDNDRNIARAIVYDEDGWFYFTAMIPDEK